LNANLQKLKNQITRPHAKDGHYTNQPVFDYAGYFRGLYSILWFFETQKNTSKYFYFEMLRGEILKFKGVN